MARDVLPASVIVGLQWGDEGKGKITDMVARDADVVVRFQGGSNAGHTVVAAGEEFRFHLVPSGILRPECTVILGNGMVVNLDVLAGELDDVKRKVPRHARVLISDRAHLVMPYHIEQDRLEEAAKGARGIGTTLRGIGPCYCDKVARTGLRTGDLLDESLLKARLNAALRMKKGLFGSLGGGRASTRTKMLEKLREWRARFGGMIRDTASYVNKALDRGERVLLEGAQGTHLDIDHGTYPYVTSSSTIAGGGSTGSGIPPGRIGKVIGVSKAYTTRVGSGPFPTELFDEEGKHLLTKGHEFGTTTGRPRRCGWLDLVMLRYSNMVNGTTEVALTKLDCLGGLDKVAVCTHYLLDGKRVGITPSSLSELERCRPIYRWFDGWQDLGSDEILSSSEGLREGLPENLRDYVRFIERSLAVPITMVSVGPGREQTIATRRTRNRGTRPSGR